MNKKKRKFKFGDICYVKVSLAGVQPDIGQIFKYSTKRGQYVFLSLIEVLDPKVGFTWSYINEDDLVLAKEIEGIDEYDGEILFPKNTKLSRKNYQSVYSFYYFALKDVYYKREKMDYYYKLMNFQYDYEKMRDKFYGKVKDESFDFNKKPLFKVDDEVILKISISTNPIIGKIYKFDGNIFKYIFAYKDSDSNYYWDFIREDELTTLDKIDNQLYLKTKNNNVNLNEFKNLKTNYKSVLNFNFYLEKIYFDKEIDKNKYVFLQNKLIEFENFKKSKK